ncbi:TPA: outer membrane lipoprotein chaperone LolA [Legionella pneumophila]|nr:outer membrane lipoprotein chaperone LolA [Legionella pneumophila]HAT7794815.1 outer membrane lipoprotein chaperone LolA [Legionella pneumophila]HAT8718801.1 outer membrane lipoprotein chaperone LolA [Legionella pneumophila]HAU1194161.1 outer membrane lipoprotein chaperone LolA [Legionella pneumophila]HAU1272000.1 outer membrane lipoprotein chaperone LolA [Legionella pneumophila]
MNMNKLFLFVLLIFSGGVFSQTSAEVLQSKLNAIQTMTANFSQIVKAKNREVSRSSGSMALQRPGRFRWETKDPLEQLIVADGQKMWIYDVDLEQVTVKNQEKGLGGTAALFLSGYDETLTHDFDVSEKQTGKLTVFDLKSKSAKENFQRIKLIFSQSTLIGLELYDQLGQITNVKLVQIKANPKLSAKLFQFKPPKGVDVVKQ